jgi:hypothetical protein
LAELEPLLLEPLLLEPDEWWEWWDELELELLLEVGVLEVGGVELGGVEVDELEPDVLGGVTAGMDGVACPAVVEVAGVEAVGGEAGVDVTVPPAVRVTVAAVGGFALVVAAVELLDAWAVVAVDAGVVVEAVVVACEVAGAAVEADGEPPLLPPDEPLHPLASAALPTPASKNTIFETLMSLTPYCRCP